jgi:outer membrane biosynthesis protein TonB
MAQEKSVIFNKSRTEEFLKSLDAKPKGRTEMMFQAIIVSLIAHIFVLFVTQMLTQDNRMASEEVIYQELEMDMIDEELIPPPDPQEFAPRDGELRNIVANENSERSKEAKSYRGMSSSQINEQVYNELKNMESEEFARLKGSQADYTVQDNKSGQGNASEQAKKSDYDWYREQQNNKSYSGRVTASYNMKGRDAQDQPLPTYRCKTHGTVVLIITVNQLGQVTDAKIDETRSALDECLRTESQKYAMKWKFDYKGDTKKQDGSITFTFSSQ